jgi:hypothetical protein
LLLDVLLQLRVLPLVFFTEFFDVHHDHVFLSMSHCDPMQKSKDRL